MSEDQITDIVEIEPVDPGPNPLSSEGPEPVEETVETEKAEKPSIDEALKKAMDSSKAKEADKAKDAAAKDAPKEEKPAPEPKQKAAPVDENAPEKDAEEKARPDRRQSESRKFDTAPSRFIPEAGAKWANVPTEVKSEVHRVLENADREVQQYRESHQFREELKEYEEMGKQHGVSVKQALENYVGIEKKFYEDPASGFRQLLTNMNMNPHQAISSILQAYGGTPQELIQYITKNPQAYAQQPRQQQPRQDPAAQHVSALEQKIASLENKFVEQEKSVAVERVMPVIRNFAESNPGYYDLEPKIAEILKSGIIEKIHGESLPADKKLSEAYRMAGGSMSPSRSEPEGDDSQHSRTEKQRPVNPAAGKLSIGGSPSAGDIKSTTKKKSPPSIDDALKNAVRRAS